MTTPAPSRPLRAQLLVMLALVLLATASCSTVALFLVRHWLVLDERLASVIGVSVALAVFAIAGAVVVDRMILEPLRYLTDAARDIAAGNLQRRMPTLRAAELQDLCTHVDRLAFGAFEDRAHVVRAENLTSLGRLAGSLAHEIGKPLGALRGHLHVLTKQLRDEDHLDAVASCEALEVECGRIERIVRGLLDYARTRAPAASPVAVNDVVRDAIERVRSRHVLVGIHLTIDLPPEPLFVSAERHDLEQVFVNIFENALEAMNGRGQLVIRVERAARFTLREPARRRDGDPDISHPPSSRAQRWLAGNDATEIAKIIIADSGPGIAQDLIDRIFDPFFTTKATGTGAGLGLAVVARIVESAHGTIWATRAREGGAAFHLLFPAIAATIGVPPSMTARRRPTPPLSTPRV